MLNDMRCWCLFLAVLGSDVKAIIRSTENQLTIKAVLMDFDMEKTEFIDGIVALRKLIFLQRKFIKHASSK